MVILLIDSYDTYPAKFTVVYLGNDVVPHVCEAMPKLEFVDASFLSSE